jgi:thioredoxin reductase (NADPH)
VSKPLILTVDDDPAVSNAITRDLRRRYGSDYQVVRSESGATALSTLGELLLRGRTLALVAADQRMPHMTGVEMLSQIRQQAPTAKLVLLTAYADTDVAIQAINDIGLDYYLLKPWDPPDEHLYPVFDDLLGDWQANRIDDAADVRVIGDRWSEQTQLLKTFLFRNHVHYAWLDPEGSDEARRLLAATGAAQADLPVVLLEDGRSLLAPTPLEVATALGLRTRPEQPLYDLCIVGGGPAGLAAAVYGASEGLSTVLIEREAPGGQAGQSSAIENYLGFPTGVSGYDLTHRAVAQASRLGAEIVLARDVASLASSGPVRLVAIEGGDTIEARTVIVASGVSYRLLGAPGLDALTGRGVYYGAAASEARARAGEVVCVVGAANSAGQAALNFARFAERVVLLVRGDALEKSMSKYLVDRIVQTSNVDVRLQSEVAEGFGTDHLEGITIVDHSTETKEELATSGLFVYIGAAPRTDWLGDGVARDPHGFILTGPELTTAEPRVWSQRRPPFALETSLPGVFAAGDVRLDSMKRVASAVGEGAMAVYFVHRYLAAT